jgi:hypothetical protein
MGIWQCSRSWIMGAKKSSSAEKVKEHVPIEPAVPAGCR